MKTPIALLGRNYFVTKIRYCPSLPWQAREGGRVWWTVRGRFCDPPALPDYVKNGKIWRVLFFMRHVINGYFRLEQRAIQRSSSFFLLKLEIPETTAKQTKNKQTKQQQQKLHKLFTYELKTLVSSSWFLSNWPFPTCLTSQWSQHSSKGQSLPFEATRNSVESSNSGKHPPHPFAGHQSYKHQMLLWHWLWLWTLHVPYIWLLESFLHKNRWWLSPHILPCGPPGSRNVSSWLLLASSTAFYCHLL